MRKESQIELTGEQLTAVGNFLVSLTSCGNPDFGEDPKQPAHGVRDSVKRVRSLSQASKVCSAFIAVNSLGGGNWTGGTVTKDGKVVARVSYNGRVWEAA